MTYRATEVTVVTDSKRDLSELIEKSTGEKLTALDKMYAPSRTHEKETDTQSKSDVDKISTHAELGRLDDKSVSEFDRKFFFNLFFKNFGLNKSSIVRS